MIRTSTIHRALSLAGILLFLLSLFPATPYAQNTAPILQDNPREERMDSLRTLEKGVRAARFGLAAIGIDYLRPLIDDPDLTEEEQEQAFLALLTALIQHGDPAEVIRLLREEGPTNDPARSLRWAMADFLLGNTLQSQNRIRRISPESLDSSDRGWYYLTQGLIASRRGDPSQAAEFFNEASRAADSPFLQDNFDSIRARLDILRGEVDEATVLSLKSQFESAVSLPMRFQLAREYALVLMGQGQTENAIEFLDQFSRNTEADDATIADQILLPLAVFRGLGNSEGRATLWEILRTGSDRDNLRITLNLLLREIDEAKLSQSDTFASIISTRPDHPIRDRLIFAQAQLLSRLGKQAEALELVEMLIKDYPGTPVLQAARLSSAFLAWQQSPPQFRRAATWLLEVVPDLQPEQRPFYLHLAGDLYYRNRDYSSAASAYFQAWALKPTEETAYQYTLSLLQNGQPDLALEWSNANLVNNPLISAVVSWRINWNLASILIKDGRAEEALGQIETVLSNEQLAPSTRINFEWLQAYSLSLLGLDEDALQRVDKLLASLETQTTPAANEEVTSTPISSSTNGSIDSIFAQTLLLKGEILFKNAQPDEGTKIMASLRDRYPESRAAVLSYLFEARYFAGRDLSGEAQQRLVNLADRFPSSDYAPLALYEAAIIAESRRTPESIAEAIRYLENLVARYPNHELAIHARLKEGEILRSLGDFSSARLLFENTAKRYSTHPLQYQAEIGGAETVLANPDASPEDLLNAGVALAKVATVPNVPPSVLLESQLKRAETFRRAKQPETARRVLWENIEPLLDQRDSYNAAVAFWLSKSLLELSAWSDADGLPEEATRLLEIIDNQNLPGRKIARAKLRARELRPTDS